MRYILSITLFLFSFMVAPVAHSQIQGMTISGDGKSYAALSKTDGKTFLIVYNAEDASEKPVFFA